MHSSILLVLHSKGKHCNKRLKYIGSLGIFVFIINYVCIFLLYYLKKTLPNVFSDLLFEDILSVSHSFFHRSQDLIMFQLS